MTSVIYASFGALLIIWLSLNVIKHRRVNKISIGDDKNEILKISIAAQSNAIEYIPIAVLLLFALELNKGNLLLVHALGILLIAGRILHARAFLSDNMKGRVLGMQMTLFVIITLAAVNLIYLPYAKILHF